MFKAGKTYRHKNTLDTDLFVIEVYEVTPGYTKLLGRLHNRHYSKLISYEIEPFTIPSDEYGQWEELK